MHRARAAVAELRRRKQRDDKPLAVMVADAAAAERFCEISAAERALLTSPRRPIVLLRRKSNGSGSPSTNRCIAAAVAPGNPYLGVMLPYTPLHHLLVERRGRPLVMTSGNRSDEPIAYRDEAALAQLGDIADVFLTHDRQIHIRCDDSVTRVLNEAEYPVRRSRGYAPQPIKLASEFPLPMLAVGGQLKATFALAAAHGPFPATTWATWTTTRRIRRSNATCGCMKNCSRSSPN